MTEVLVLQIVIASSAVFYGLFFIWDRQFPRDEREQLIELKAVDFQQKVSLFTLLIVVGVYLYNPLLDALYPILAFTLASVYMFIFGKIYFRILL
jgi:hypothetical protein